MEMIENRTFDEIKIGDSASLVQTLRKKDIELFAVMSGDVNPAHVDEVYARNDPFHKIIAHGMWGASLISTVLGTRLPGPGTIYLGQTLNFHHPVVVGDTLTVTVTVTEEDAERHHVTFDCQCLNQRGQVVINGSATVIAPTEKVKRPRVLLPEVRVYEHSSWYEHLLAKVSAFAPIRTAVVYPIDSNALLGAIEAAQAKLIIPILIGPPEKIQAVALAHEVDLSPYQILPAEQSYDAAEQAAALASAGDVDAVMKGSLHSDEFMRAIFAAHLNLSHDRRMSHVFVLDVPAYPRPLFITDAALNIAPDLMLKRDIVQNAIDLAHVLGIAMPRVAILSAIEILPGVHGHMRPVRILARQSPYYSNDSRWWSPDNYFEGGELANYTSPVSGTDDPELYETERWGNFSYAIPVSPGKYSVTLLFAVRHGDWDQPSTASDKPAVAHIFNVFCNGKALLQNFDLVKEARQGDAVIRKFASLEPNSQGKLLLSFVPVEGYATVTGIEVLPQ